MKNISSEENEKKKIQFKVQILQLGDIKEIILFLLSCSAF